MWFYFWIISQYECLKRDKGQKCNLVRVCWLKLMLTSLQLAFCFTAVSKPGVRSKPSTKHRSSEQYEAVEFLTYRTFDKVLAHTQWSTAYKILQWAPDPPKKDDPFIILETAWSYAFYRHHEMCFVVDFPIFAIEAPSEMFSAAGNTVTSQRATLKPGRVEELVFLRDHL